MVRDSSGVLLCVRFKFIPLMFYQMKLLEACAIKKGLQCCFDLSLPPCVGLVMECNAPAIVYVFNKEDVNMYEP